MVGLLKGKVCDGREVGEDGGGVEGEEVRETLQLETTEAEANQEAAQLRSVVQRCRGGGGGYHECNIKDPFIATWIVARQRNVPVTATDSGGKVAGRGASREG